MFQTFVTCYCSQAHRMKDGKPVAHSCFVLPPRALELELSGDQRAAMSLIQGETLVPHPGITGVDGE